MVARGLSREFVQQQIGVDIGYRGSNYIRQLRGIDRTEYQRQHIIQRVDINVLKSLLSRLASGVIDGPVVLSECGVGPSCRLRLQVIFESVGLSDEYGQAKKAQYKVRSKHAENTFMCRYGVRAAAHIPGMQERVQKTMLGRYGAAHALQCEEFKEKAKKTTKEHYGVEFALQSPEIRKKSRETVRAKYGVDYVMQNPDIYARVLETTKARYGVEHPLQSEVCREKLKATNVEKYGVECVFQSPEIREKGLATLMERYHVTVPGRSPEIMRRTIETNRKRYGCDFPMQNPDVYAKSDATCLARYGVHRWHILNVPEIHDAWVATCMARYGVPHPLASAEVREKFRATMCERYGGPYTLSSPVLFERVLKTVRARYGVDNTFLVPEFREKARQTCLEKYCVEHSSQSLEVKDKTRRTMIARYGVPYGMLCPELRDKMLASKDKNGTHNGSKSEDLVYEKLVSVFGESDVLRQYHSDAYPYRCDFYIKSRDMYIECNGYFSHYHHWFGSYAFDKDILANFREKLSPTFYEKLLSVWCKSDLKKREVARDGNLNYVVFWGDNSEDADIWFAMGCPDGHDWEREYSWLPDRDLSYTGSFPEKLTLSDKTVFPAVLAAQWREFYKNEFAFWSGRFDLKWGTVQARLYANRCKYIVKKPDELTNLEILRGLTISGMVRGYSHFQFGGLLEFLNKYSIKSVYDPCAGWGERMLVFSQFNIAYLGVDINANLFDGYCNLIDQYGLDQTSVICGDSSKLDLSHAHHDCVFTCPPYESKEIYTEYGAENFSHDAFIAWWEQVVKHAVCDNTRIFAYQIDQACKSDMNEVLLNFGWHLDMQIPVAVNKTSHMVRSKGVKKKKNFEEIQVFVRDI